MSSSVLSSPGYSVLSPVSSYLYLLLFFLLFLSFFFNDTATTEIYTLSLHDALPICPKHLQAKQGGEEHQHEGLPGHRPVYRSEEHTSELQSHHDLVCRLLLEKKKDKQKRRRVIKKRILTQKHPIVQQTHQPIEHPSA